MSPSLALSRFAPFALLTASALLAQDEAADRRADAAIATARNKLAMVGYPVPKSVERQTRSPSEVLDDVRAQQPALMPANSYRVQHALMSAFGRNVGKDPEALAEATIAAMVRGLSAYYDPLNKAFVMLPTATREVSEQLAGSQLPLVTHELVHAHQDARGDGMVAWFDADKLTLDGAMARRVTIEGEAELAAVLALNGPERLAEPPPEDHIGALFAGELTGLIYDAGRRLTWTRYQLDGIAAVKELWTKPPQSTEQALHAAKYGNDAPTEVTLPVVEDLPVQTASVIGELLTFNLLRQLQVDRLEAQIAAAGWDGDRFAVYGVGDELTVAWRTVWDREVDATDFANRIRATDRGQVRLESRVVDWVYARDETLQARIIKVLAANHSQPEGSIVDAASTAAAEVALRGAAPVSASSDGYWQHPKFGLSVPIPDGWSTRKINGIEMLFSPAAKGFRTNINVTAQPANGLDLDALIAGTEGQMKQLGLTLHRIEKQQRGDTAIAFGEYSGKIGRSPDLHFLMVAYIQDRKQVIVTATTSAEQWQSNEQVLRELMAGVRIGAAGK